MKKCKKLFMAIICVSTMLFVFTACENMSEEGSSSATTESKGQAWLSPGKFGSTDNTITKKDDTTSSASTEESEASEEADDSEENETRVNESAGTNGTESEVDENAAENDSNDEAGDYANDTENEKDDTTEKAENAGEELADDVESLVDDVADGIGDAIDNLGGGSFDAYDDAKEYLLGKLQEDNAAANYELREEVEELTAYNSNDSGAEAYTFSVYETDGNEKIGIYYVDKDTGKIYRYMGKNSIEAY